MKRLVVNIKGGIMLMEMYKEGRKVAEIDLTLISSEDVFQLIRVQMELMHRTVTIDGVPIMG